MGTLWTKGNTMLTRRRLLGITVLSMLALCSAAGADTPAQARKSIEAIYRKMEQMTNNKDFDAAMVFYTDDLQVIPKTGAPMNREQAIKQGREVFLAADTIQIRDKILQFRLKGKEAIATVRVFGKMTLTHPETQQYGTLYMDTTSEDTWTKTAKGWLMKKSRILTEKTRVVPHDPGR